MRLTLGLRNWLSRALVRFDVGARRAKWLVVHLVYGVSAVFAYFMHVVGWLLTPLRPYYSSALHRRVTVVLARSGLSLLPLNLVLGVVLVALETWAPHLVPAWLAIGAQAIGAVLTALTVVINRPGGQFMLGLPRHGVMNVHLVAAKGKLGSVGSQLAQLGEVVELAKACGTRQMLMDSPLLVCETTYALVVAKLQHLFQDAGLQTTIKETPARELSAVKTGLLAPYRKLYSTLRRGRLTWTSDVTVLSRRLVLELH